MAVRLSGWPLFCICLLCGLVACSAPAESAGALPSGAPTPWPPAAAQPEEHSAPGGVLLTLATNAPGLPAATVFSPDPDPPGCALEQGYFEQGSLASQSLPDPLEFKVYLPPCYDQNSDQRYPVLYLVHGQSYTHDQWDRLGVGESAGRLVAAGEIAPFLIVLPRDRSWAQPDEDLFGQALVNELLPYVDSAYRTQPQRLYRAIGGLSRGAAWAVHLGLSRWQEFGAIGAHSLPVFFSDASKIPNWLEAIPAASRPRLYLDIGEKDRPETLASARWFESLLTEAGFPHEWHLFPGYHEEAYWQSHVEQYLRWYASEW